MRVGVRAVACRAVAALLALQFGGCSLFLIERPPPPEKRGPYFFCHDDMRLVGADAMIAALAYANFSYALSKGDADYQGETLSQGSDLLISAVLAAMFTISASVGRRWVLDCRAAGDAARLIPAVTTPRPSPARAKTPPVDDGPIVAPVDPDPPGEAPAPAP